MIARYWRGQVRASDVDAYCDYVERTGIKEHRATPGNRGSMMLVRPNGDEVEVAVLSLWESLDSIVKFAGEDPQVAVFYPEDERYLTQKDPFATHFDVAALSMPGAEHAAGATRSLIPHSIYAEGCVQSLRFQEEDGEATVGVITPGTYTFSTTTEEHVTLLAGTLDVSVRGRTARYHAGDTYVIPSGDDFHVRADVPVAYLCRYVGQGGPP